MVTSWLNGFNPIPAFPGYSGDYDVGSVDVEIPASELGGSYISPSGLTISTVAFRIFYPCEKPSKPSRPIRFFQKPQRSIVSAYARFLGAGSALSDLFAYFPQLLYYITIPAHRNAELRPCPDDSKRWPVCFFSHGLGGSRNGYSQICGSLASHGMIVIATDHRDGTAPVSHVRATEEEPAQKIYYTRYSHQPSEETYEARDGQLKIRLWEISCAFEAVRRMDLGEAVTNLDDNLNEDSKTRYDVLSKFKESLDIHRPGKVTFSGHSFGATTTVQFLKSIYYSRYKIRTHLLKSEPSADLASQINSSTPTILLDLWTMPLNSPDTAVLKAQPMPSFYPSEAPGGSNLLAVLSEAFFNWRGNFSAVQNVLTDPFATTSPCENRPAAHIFYPLTSAHLSQSDFGVLFPRIMKITAKACEPERTLRLNVRAILQVLRGAGIPVTKTSIADMELSEPDPTATEDDWRILSTEKGIIRGWVALRVDDDRKDIKNQLPQQPKITPRMSSFGQDELQGAFEESEGNSSDDS